MQKTLEETTKEYLCNSINNQQNIYSRKLIEYMYSLVNLESSILKQDRFSEDDLKVLEGIELFRRVANFNAYYKTIDVYRKYAIERRMLDKLQFESIPYNNETLIYLNDDKNRDLLVQLKKLSNADDINSGYEIDYHRDEKNKETLFDRFGQTFEDYNDIRVFDAESPLKSTKVYPHIKSRVIKISRSGGND